MNKRLVVVSNRLPIAISQEGGSWQIKPGAGGLVTALEPLMKRNRGVWIGWPGCGPEAPLDRLVTRFAEEHGYELKTVPLEEQEVEKYYRGFSNEAPAAGIFANCIRIACWRSFCTFLSRRPT
ncbi:MAG: trehalose-6-phosphate synthase [Desulfuromonadales bacterium]